MAAGSTLVPKRAAIYCRVSTGRQEEEGTSLETQEAACRRYAAAHGYVAIEEHVYREVHTRVELWERRVLQKLRDAVRRGDVDVVVAHAIDRLSGDPVHLGVILSEAEYAGAAVEFVTEPLDDSQKASSCGSSAATPRRWSTRRSKSARCAASVRAPRPAS